jgi:hypothetical protein
LLRPLLDDLVFVGGCATALLITDQAAAEVRPTFDVDAIAEITSYADYVVFSERLRNLGFTEDAPAPGARHLRQPGFDASHHGSHRCGNGLAGL